MASRRPPPERERGFTLVEVLVAFAVATLFLVPLLRLFSGGMGGLAGADRATTATLWAQSVLEARDGAAPLVPGTESGDLPGGYRWQRTVALYSDATMSQQSRVLAPYEVTLTVTWSDGRHDRAVTLATLRLALPPGR
jgi:general secretion pathway protein I